jgi:aspartyl-tRNA(Asn)/glutamyl-tRNA(Gln) amidotransferase subunit C
MAQLSSDDVRHIAKLCRLKLAEDEVNKFTTELTSILGYIDRLQKVDTEGVEPLKNVMGMSSVFRPDKISEDTPERDAMLDCSPLPIVDNQIQTPSAHG